MCFLLWSGVAHYVHMFDWCLLPQDYGYARNEVITLYWLLFDHAGDEKDHLQVILLRIDSSLQGVLSCLPDFIPSLKNGKVGSPVHSFFIAGASGPSVGSTKLREKAAEIIHAACRYNINLIFVFNLSWLVCWLPLSSCGEQVFAGKKSWRQCFIDTHYSHYGCFRKLW